MKPFLAIFNIFIDPAEAVNNMEGRFAWVWPFLLACSVGIFVAISTTPIVLQVMRTNPPANIPAAQMEKVLESTTMMSKVSMVTTPLITALMLAITTLILFAACSVLDIKTTFGRLFTFSCYAGLILSLAQIASVIVLKFKGEIQSMKELQPSFGPDMFLSEEASGVLVGFLRCLGLFHIWYFVVLVLGLAALLKITKGKALGVASPVIFLFFIFTVAMGMFSNR